MSDKKKKKSKQKQKQKQQQTQQVIVNVGGRIRRREEPRRENKLNMSAQPPPIVQYVYRDNLALNAINERMRENAITQTLLKTSQQLASQSQSQQAPKLATPSAALYQQQQPAMTQNPAPTKAQQPTTAPPPLSFSVVKDILEKSKVFNKTDIPNENTNKAKTTEFDKITKPPPPPPITQKNNLLDDTDFEDDSLPVRTPFKATKDGLPYKRSKDYGFYMENYIGQIPPEKRNKKQQKAYEQYMDSLSKPSGNDDDDETVKLPPPPQNSASVQPVDFDDNNDEEELYVFPPLKRKPT